MGPRAGKGQLTRAKSAAPSQRGSRPWHSPKWKTRRAELLARTASCEWCRRELGTNARPNVHHLNAAHETVRGEPRPNSYEAMKDDEVVIICARCHRDWHRFGVRAPHPILVCPKCGSYRAPNRKLCFDCAVSAPGCRCPRCGNVKTPDLAICWRCTSLEEEEVQSVLGELDEDPEAKVDPALRCECGMLKCRSSARCGNC